MIYTNETIRRQDRLLPQTEALDLLCEGEYGVLSMVDMNGHGYGIPLSYAWDGDKYIYIHGAPQGRKLENIAHNPKISFCVVGRTKVIPHKFTTHYESIVVKGDASTGLSDDERMRALELMLDKYWINVKSRWG